MKQQTLKNFLGHLLITFMIANCGPAFESTLTEAQPQLTEDQTMVGDMIVAKDQVVGFGLSPEEKAIVEEEYIEEFEEEHDHDHENEGEFQSSGVSYQSRYYNNLWKKGILRFTFHSDVSLHLRTHFLNECKKMGKYAKVSCRPKRDSDKDYVEIITGTTPGGWSHLGKIGGKQQLYVSLDHWYIPGIIIHELMHAFSIKHEQSHPNRDKFVKIHLENVIPGTENNFSILRDENRRKITRYDFGSIMHYGPTTLSRNGRPTITSLVPGQSIRRNTVMSQYDHKILWKIYGGEKPVVPHEL